MTTVARTWLPSLSQVPPRLQAGFADAVAGWSAHWFADAPTPMGAFRKCRTVSPSGTAFDWRGSDDGLSVGCADDAAVQTGARMIDVPARDRSDPDRRLLEQIGTACLDDLRDRVGKVAGTARADSWRQGVAAPDWTASVGDAVAIGLSDTLVATLAARTLPSAVPPPLGSGREALAQIAIEVSAAVGRAELTVADLRALEIGDVVVLDRRVEDPVPIAIDRRPIDRGRARVRADAPHTTLEIVEAAT